MYAICQARFRAGRQGRRKRAPDGVKTRAAKLRSHPASPATARLSWTPFSPSEARRLSFHRPLLACGCLLLAACAAPRPHAPATPPVAPITGVPDCDHYLTSYVACHRTAGIFPADQLQTHEQSMRQSLLEAAADPGTRPYLAARCRVLATQLEHALHGRACGSTPNTTGR